MLESFEGVEIVDLRGLPLDAVERRYAESGHDEYHPFGTRWYFDGSDPRNAAELAPCVTGLVDEYRRLEAAGKRPSHVVVDNYGGHIVAPLHAWSCPACGRSAGKHNRGMSCSQLERFRARTMSDGKAEQLVREIRLIGLGS